MLEYTKELYKNTGLINESIIITLNKYKNEIKKIITKSQKVIYEPMKKGTQYQIQTTLSSNELNMNDILIITPQDHYFKNKKQLGLQLDNAIKFQKESEKIILFGSKIDRKNINLNYGWIYINNIIHLNKITIGDIIKFKEKPNKNIQIQMLSDKTFYNMGIFIGKVKIFYDIIQEQNYELYRYIINLKYKINNLKTIYKKLSEKSFDKEILEKQNKRLLMISTDFEWDDIGIYKNLQNVVQQI